MRPTLLTAGTLLMAASSGCAPVGPQATVPPPPERVVRCSTALPRETRSDTVRQNQDLVITVGHGHQLRVPWGAAPTGTEFVLTQPASDTVMVDAYAVGHSDQFPTSVELSLRYAGCAAHGPPSGYRIYRREGPSTWSDVGGSQQGNDPVVTVSLQSLSTYVLIAP